MSGSALNGGELGVSGGVFNFRKPRVSSNFLTGKPTKKNVLLNGRVVTSACTAFRQLVIRQRRDLWEIERLKGREEGASKFLF